MRTKGVLTVIATAAWLVATSWSGRIAAADLSGEATLHELKRGGYVIYLRHDQTDRSRGDSDPINLHDCDTQRLLSLEGRVHAQKIGEAFRAMGIPVGLVYASPTCRATETAELAFPNVKPAVAHGIIYSLALPREELSVAAAELREMLATPPTDGTNTVLVGHTTNLQQAAGVWLKDEGGALIFRPDAHGGFALIGSVGPADFARAAK